MNKFQKIFTRLLTTTAAFASGGVLGSLCFYHNEAWEYHLPIAILCLSAERFINTDK